jgi:hypothetical protein
MGIMMIGKEWYEWDDIQQFDTWHQAKIIELNLPNPSVNQATNEVNTKVQKTEVYTIAHEVDGKVIAIVEDEHSYGLRKTTLRIKDEPPPL